MAELNTPSETLAVQSVTASETLAAQPVTANETLAVQPEMVAGEPFDAERALGTIKKLREQEKTFEKKLREQSRELERLRSLSPARTTESNPPTTTGTVQSHSAEIEQYATQIAELRETIEAQRRELRSQHMRQSIRAAAQRARVAWVDEMAESDAIELLVRGVNLDGDDEPTFDEKLLRELVKNRSYLVKQTVAPNLNGSDRGRAEDDWKTRANELRARYRIQ